MSVDRDPECVERWPECHSFGYDPRCCRFPKSCSADIVPPIDVEAEIALTRSILERGKSCAEVGNDRGLTLADSEQRKGEGSSLIDVGAGVEIDRPGSEGVAGDESPTVGIGQVSHEPNVPEWPVAALAKRWGGVGGLSAYDRWRLIDEILQRLDRIEDDR